MLVVTPHGFRVGPAGSFLCSEDCGQQEIMPRRKDPPLRSPHSCKSVAFFMQSFNFDRCFRKAPFLIVDNALIARSRAARANETQTSQGIHQR